MVIGEIKEDAFISLIEFIYSLDIPIQQIIDNL